MAEFQPPEGLHQIVADRLRDFTCRHVPLSPGTAIGQPEACPDCLASAALAAVVPLVRAETLREAADRFAVNWYDREQAVLIARELRNLADMGRATALDPAQPLPVADGSEATADMSRPVRDADGRIVAAVFTLSPEKSND